MAFSERRGFGGPRSSGPRELFDATCAECGNETQVPFRPSGDRPVYCRDCFQAKGGGAPRGGPRGGGGGRPRDDRPREMFDATCSNCGSATQVPFRPTEGRPVYCRDCFAEQRGR